ncbi:TPM domain-containing protein, partial [Kitasatospora herbaricolor]|uniref:TPM domain-containing protein n=1 Tax=Kitasatospora herbaricolor TaxID=68217 RepID=UPI0036DA0837
MASAQDPVDLGSGHVVDQAGVLDAGQTSTVENAAEKLYSDHRVDLYVVYVDRFTNPTDAADWANQTAANNNLGPSDYLLAVATDGRAYYLSGDSAGPVTDDQLDQIERNDVEPKLKAGDWSGAAVAAADGLGDAVGGSGGGTGVVWFIVIAVVVIGLIVFFVLRRRSASKKARSAPGGPAAPQNELQTMPIADLARRAGSALVQTDDAVRTSEEELGFATAQYGADAVVPFQAALDAAKAQLRDAFTLKQKLDDAEQDTQQQTRDWIIQIVQLCAAANDALDKQADAFDELRALEKRIPQATAEVQAAAAAVQSRIAQSNAGYAALSERYTE